MKQITQAPFSLHVTQEALNYLKHFISDQDLIHLSYEKTGCSGYKHKLTLIPKNEVQDKSAHIIHTVDDLCFYVLESDMLILNNLTISMSDDAINKRIIYSMPQAKAYCGCGESFTL